MGSISCADCGQPTTSKTGLCMQCQYAQEARNRGAAVPGWGDRPAVPCEVCGVPTADFTGVCSRGPECRTEHTRRYNAARRENKNRAARKWRRANPESARATDARNNANRKRPR